MLISKPKHKREGKEAFNHTFRSGINYSRTVSDISLSETIQSSNIIRWIKNVPSHMDVFYRVIRNRTLGDWTPTMRNVAILKMRIQAFKKEKCIGMAVLFFFPVLCLSIQTIPWKYTCGWAQLFGALNSIKSRFRQWHDLFYSIKTNVQRHLESYTVDIFERDAWQISVDWCCCVFLH